MRRILVLSEEKSKYPVLKAENPVFREDEPNMNAFAVEKLLKVFSINPKTVMRYTDADENIIFVQSQATLKVSTDGVMTYTTVAGSKGLAIEGIGAGAAAAADVLTQGAKLPIGVLNAVSSGEGTKLYLSGLEENQGSYIVTFDYMHNGTPVCLGGEFAGRNAVRMEFEGGYLKNYTQILRSYEQIERETTVEPRMTRSTRFLKRLKTPMSAAGKLRPFLWLMMTTAATGKSSPYGF